jgi:SAUR family protein
MPPKGFVPVRVVEPVGGGAKEEEGERFVVPVGYVNHPLFVDLLKQAEEEYGFHQQGVLTIPCGVDNFRRVKGIIDDEQHGSSSGHFPFCIATCFRA